MIKPKLLTTERVVQIYAVYEATGQLFEDSPMTELFGHIAALSKATRMAEHTTVKELLDDLHQIAVELSLTATEADEFVACSEIEAAITKTEETFKRTKDIDSKLETWRERLRRRDCDNKLP